MSWEFAGHVPQKKKKKGSFLDPFKEDKACMAAMGKDYKGDLSTKRGPRFLNMKAKPSLLAAEKG